MPRRRKHPKKNNFGECDYHLCKKKSKLYKCKYCGGKFCRTHRKPKPPVSPDFKHTSAKAELLMEEYRKENAHPCFPYMEHWERKVKRKQQEEYDALDRLLRKKDHSKESAVVLPSLSYSKRSHGKSRHKDYSDEIERTKRDSFERSKNHRKRRFWRKYKGWIKFLILVIIVLLLWKFDVFSKAYDALSDLFVGSKTLSGILPSDNVDEDKSMEIFIQLNKLMDENNKSKFTFKKESYTSAVIISKQSIETGDIGSKENYAQIVLPRSEQDNVLQVNSEVLASFLIKEINNNLDKDYELGAVGCYKYVCTFVGAERIVLSTDSNKDESPGVINEVTTKNVEEYRTNPKTIKLYAVGDFVVYGGLNNYLSSIDRSISYYYTPPTTKDFILKELDNQAQKDYLNPIVDEIKSQTGDPKQQARKAIMLVQMIPYDWDSFTTGDIDSRYPYEVLYDMKGVCAEKAGLMAYLLRELGFGVVIFEFHSEDHRAVGIKCKKGNYNTQYCFIESTDVYPIGSIPTGYVGGVDIRGATPEVIVISDGMTY